MYGTAHILPIAFSLKPGNPEPFIKPLYGECELRESQFFFFLVIDSNERTNGMDGSG